MDFTIPKKEGIKRNKLAAQIVACPCFYRLNLQGLLRKIPLESWQTYGGLFFISGLPIAIAMAYL